MLNENFTFQVKFLYYSQIQAHGLLILKTGFFHVIVCSGNC